MLEINGVPVDLKEIKEDNRLLVQFAKFRDNAIIPSKKDEDAGYDIYTTLEDEFIIKPYETKLLPTGIGSIVPEEYYFQIQERGSTGSKGIKYGAGVIDSSYRGEWFIPITNTNRKPIIFTNDPQDYSANAIFYPLDKAICQAVLLPVPKTVVQEISLEELQNSKTERGTGALGSSGK